MVPQDASEQQAGEHALPSPTFLVSPLGHALVPRAPRMTSAHRTATLYSAAVTILPSPPTLLSPSILICNIRRAGYIQIFLKTPSIPPSYRQHKTQLPSGLQNLPISLLHTCLSWIISLRPQSFHVLCRPLSYKQDSGSSRNRSAGAIRNLRVLLNGFMI